MEEGKCNRELLHISRSIWNYFLSKHFALSTCRVPSQCSEYTRRLGATKHQGQFRMETRCFGFSRDCNTYGTTNSGSVCTQTLPWTPSIHCIESTDSSSIRIDLFLHPWNRKYGFSFLPFSLISHVTRKIFKEKIDHLITVKPTWQTQSWYTQLLNMSVQSLYLLPQLKIY